jgi:hypothetical protein
LWKSSLIPAAPDSSYPFAILVGSVANHPQIKSPAQYFRSVRHALEKEGLKTRGDGFPIEISGMPFTGAIMEVPGERVSCFRGVYSTFANEYIVSFDLTARKEEVIEKLVASLIKFKGPTKQSRNWENLSNVLASCVPRVHATDGFFA